MYIKKKQFLIFLFLFMGILSSFSNEKRFDRITMSEGLSNNSALCLLEDHNGFIWIGTQDGLNKYDGINFEIYKHIFGDSASLINNQINCIVETKNQELWVGTANGLCQYNFETNRFNTFSLSKKEINTSSYYIRSICETNDKKLWIGTTRGLFIIDKDRKNFSFKLVHPDLSTILLGIIILQI